MLNRKRESKDLGYLKMHWRGQLSLARSYWINGILLSLLIFVGFQVAVKPLSELPLNWVATIFFAGLAVVATVTIWQFVGIWRSATRSSRTTHKKFWPAVAKLMGIVGFLSAMAFVGPNTIDIIKALRAVNVLHLTKYTIEKQGGTELVFMGAINREAAEEIIEVLADPAIKALRVKSHGGLLSSSIRLARFIRTRNVDVVVDGYCVSACVILLAAAKNGVIVRGAWIRFHRPEPLAGFTHPKTLARVAKLINEDEKIYREFGIAPWAINLAKRQQEWTPTLAQMVEMNLVHSIYDPRLNKYFNAIEYCQARPSYCGVGRPQED
jgi:hypothetical protein